MRFSRYLPVSLGKSNFLVIQFCLILQKVGGKILRNNNFENNKYFSYSCLFIYIYFNNFNNNIGIINYKYTNNCITMIILSRLSSFSVPGTCIISSMNILFWVSESLITYKNYSIYVQYFLTFQWNMNYFIIAKTLHIFI